MSELFNAHGWKITMDSAKLPDGRVKKAPRIHRCDSASIIAFTDNNKILLLREFRAFYGTYIWMLPSGRIDKEGDLKKGAQRELQEETGYSAQSLELYCATNASEYINYTHHIFIARKLQKDPLPQDETELIEVHEVSIDEAIKNILGSDRIHTASAYALLRYAYEHSS